MSLSAGFIWALGNFARTYCQAQKTPDASGLIAVSSLTH
jgi:hypothetical protein